ncbi:hypothetical protein B4113_3878 [Geobacillus sp. B4113_201601]|nr:hypothetical protein B4113_3878 [Geobacillus sp. B4113_201601]
MVSRKRETNKHGVCSLCHVDDRYTRLYCDEKRADRKGDLPSRKTEPIVWRENG